MSLVCVCYRAWPGGFLRVLAPRTGVGFRWRVSGEPAEWFALAGCGTDARRAVVWRGGRSERAGHVLLRSRWAEAFGRRRTPGGRGRRSRTREFPSDRLERWRWLRRIRTSCTWEPASRIFARSIRMASGCSSRSMRARRGRQIGLEKTSQIGRIVVDPSNPNRVYVAALGHVYDAKSGARRLSLDRRRRALEEGAVQRIRSEQCGRDRHCGRSERCKGALCLAVGDTTAAVVGVCAFVHAGQRSV